MTEGPITIWNPENNTLIYWTRLSVPHTIAIVEDSGIKITDEILQYGDATQKSIADSCWEAFNAAVEGKLLKTFASHAFHPRNMHKITMAEYDRITGSKK